MLWLNSITAHLTWFISSEQLPQNQAVPVLFQGLNSYNLPIVVFALTLFVMAVVVDRILKTNPRAVALAKKLGRFRYIHTPVLRYVMGMVLLYSFFNAQLFGPDFSNLEVPQAVLWAELISGLLFLTGIMPHLGAAITILAYFSTFAFSPFGMILNHLHFLGATLYLLIEENRDTLTHQPACCRHMFKKWCERIKPYSQDVFRISAGLSLIFVAIQEKLLNPFYGLVFLEKYPLNFMQNLGFNFSNEHFLFCAAVTEVAIGLLLIFNILPRLVALVMLILFSITLVIFGMTELFGHALYIALIVMLLTERSKFSISNFVISK